VDLADPGSPGKTVVKTVITNLSYGF